MQVYIDLENLLKEKNIVECFRKGRKILIREVMEDFCKLVGGRDDIWYATNIEIIDYMDAARRLIFSADCRRVYNPNAISVWLEIDGDTVIEVKGGTCLEI